MSVGTGGPQVLSEQTSAEGAVPFHPVFVLLRIPQAPRAPDSPAPAPALSPS